jgi:prepilin-type N-terminal cleavage/methylation domain-containing protein
MIVRRALTAQGGKMKRKFKFAGFTLLELIIVIIILGVLAILGFTQYGKMVERARGAEAKAILGDMRKLAAAYFMEQGTLLNLPLSALNLGPGNDQIPSVCHAAHYFSYQLTSNAGNVEDKTFIATRCTANGKNPQGPRPGTLTLNTIFDTGVDTWGGDGEY